MGAVIAAWLDHHPRWIERAAHAVELDAGAVRQFILLVLTARQFVGEATLSSLCAAEGWITVGDGPSDPDLLGRLLHPWWTALSSATERWNEPEHPPWEAALPWLRAWVGVVGGVRLTLPTGIDPARILAPIGWQISGLSLVGEGLATGRQAIERPTAVASAWPTLVARARGPLERHGLLPAPPLRERAVEEIFPYVRQATALQKLVSNVPIVPGPQLFLLEEASGGGKTEAAIALAHRLVCAGRAESITFAVPWAAAPRVVQQRALDVQGILFETNGRSSLSPGRWNRREILADEPNALGDGAVSPRVLLDGFLGDARKRALWAPVGGDTLDQLLLAALPSRFAGLRLLALSRSVLLIDQLQASDANAIRGLVPLLELHAAAGGAAIVSTMALPRETRARLQAPFLRHARQVRAIDRGEYPRLVHASDQGLMEHTFAHADPDKHGLQVQLVDTEAEALARLADAVVSGRAACWVRNSVDAAIVAYAHAVRVVGVERVILVHERFTGGDRLDIERVCTMRFGRGSSGDARAGWLVIATASIEPRDLDFDVMVSDLAPIEVLLDRAGRLHRHRRDEQGDPTSGEDGRGPRELTVIAPPWTEDPSPNWLADRLPESAEAFTEHGTLWLTLRALRALRDPLYPEDVPRMLERVYAEDAMEAIPHALWHAGVGVAFEPDNELETLRHMPLLPVPSAVTPRAVREGWTLPTRLGPDATILRLARIVGDVVMPLYGSTAGSWELSELSVPSSWIARRVTGGLEQEINTAEGLMPDHGRYCVTVVLAWDPVHEQWWGVSVGARGDPVELVYRADVGLVGR